MNDDCPYNLLIKFIDSDGNYKIDFNLIPTRTRHVLLRHPNLIRGLKPAGGFGLMKNPDTNNTIGKLNNDGCLDYKSVYDK